MGDDRALLKVTDLNAAYGPVQAVRNVSLEARCGQIVAILGANGAGKTSLLRAISGVVKARSGRIEFDGEVISGRPAAAIAERGLGHVPEGREIFPFLTVEENLRMGAYLRRDRSGIAEDMDKVWSWFPILSERRKLMAGLLSGGQQQMLAFARAMMMRPKFLLMDEPSLGLAPQLTQALFALVARLVREAHLSVLLVEQTVGVALKIADYVYVMETGRVISSGRPADFAAQDDIARYYLGAETDANQGIR